MDNAIDLRQFRYFVALSEELNFGRAARRLHISQPPLSRQIRQLEDQLGVALFVRHPAGVALTRAGEAFLVEVRRALAQAENAVSVARAAGRAGGGRFVIGYTTVFDRSVIPEVMAPLQARFPEWQIVVEGKHSISIVRDICNGSIDAGFVGLHTQTRGLSVCVIHEEPLLVALAANHPLARKRRLGLAELGDLGDLPLFWFERRLNPGFYDYCRACFEKAGFKPRVIAEPSDHHITLGLIAEGRGFALIPASLQRVKRQGVVYRALKEEGSGLSMGLAVAYDAANSSPVLGEFLALVSAARAPR